MKKEIDYLNKLFNENDVVVISLSGGPDSMCLLNLLLSVEKNIKIIAAHINHNVRIESDDEEIFVRNYCKKNNIIFESMKINKYSNKNFHQESRIIRYNYMEKIISKYKATYLLTAHHGDDLMESVLMHLVRGSSFLGYSGFKKETDMGDYTIIRPLIHKSKKEIEQYDINNNIPYVVDKTNKSKEYTRNRYRLDILPVLKKENNNVIDKFNKFSNLIIEYDNYIKKIVKKEMKNVYNNNILDIVQFNKLDFLIKKNIIEDILYDYYVDDIYLLNDKHLEQIFNLIESKKVNSNISLPLHLNIVKEYNKIIFNKKEKINQICKQEFNGFYEDDFCIIKTIDKSDNNDNNIIRLKKEELCLPLFIQNRENGLKMELVNGHKKIKDIFIDSKVSKEIRNILPLLVNNKNEVIWIPGIKKSKFAKDKNEKYDIILEYYQKEENYENK